MSKLWQKSSTDTASETAKKVEAFTVGDDYRLDQALVPYDIRASKVHARAIQRAGILSEEEMDRLHSALDEILETWKAGEFEITVSDEDMHTAIENALIQKVGDLGKKIHTGRSRNDQVLTAMRLYEKEQLGNILQQTRQCAKLLIDLAEEYEQTPMPGYTHTRKAMLSSVGLWAGGYAEMLLIQAEAASGVTSLINRSPLGSAAGFGSTIDIDREKEAQEQGFDKPLVCSTTSQLSRGWIELQLVQYLGGVTAVLNRFASDVIRYSGEPEHFFALDDVVCTGSSIMPQKKNPDVAELIRGGQMEMAGYAATLQSATVNLGSGYHRDLQLTKEPVLKAFEKTSRLLEASAILIQNMEPIPENLKKACSSDLFAAEAAYEMVKDQNIPFREAYRKIAENPELASHIRPESVMKKYTHLGSPGNPGLTHLRKLCSSDS
ncbi:MAG: argininosuccinate lyase [Balneolaceae bacterium]|nr:argininosuccinate lyase [Balneolaceae bacterium]MCH8549195.1 argininosuccinate lyase [Balneolaceae bacterium]